MTFFDEMCLLDQVIMDGAAAGSVLLTATRGTALYLLCMHDCDEAHYALYVIPMWFETEAGIMREVEEKCNEDGETEDGSSIVDLFWNHIQRYYVGEME
jgi:hypothetical protein